MTFCENERQRNVAIDMIALVDNYFTYSFGDADDDTEQCIRDFRRGVSAAMGSLTDYEYARERDFKQKLSVICGLVPMSMPEQKDQLAEIFHHNAEKGVKDCLRYLKDTDPEA